jgi:hypothetical protein
MKQGKAKKQLFTIPQVLFLILSGFILGEVLVFLTKDRLALQENVQEVKADLSLILSSQSINECRALCYKPPEKVVEPKKVVTRTVPHRPRTTRLADVPKKVKNPNAIRISLTEAPPILAKVKMVNGRPMCAKKNDKGSKSDKYNYVHVDQECCLDPDEIPNPRCSYQ